MSPSNKPFQLPAPIAAKLRSVQRRMMGVGFVTAAVAAVAVMLSAMLVAMLVDYLATLYDSPVRPALTLAAMIAAITTLAGWGVYAYRRSGRIDQVAREVDRRVPYLEERWSTVTDFAKQSERNSGQAAVIHPAMARHVADEALRGDEHVDAGDVVSLSGVVKAFLALNLVTVVLVLAAIADWQSTTTLLQRFWAPSANISATKIDAQPGSTVVARGEPLLLSAELSGKPIDEATLILRGASEENNARTTEEQIMLVPHGDDTLSVSHRIRKVEDSFAYRVRGGDGQTDWHDITVSDRPTITQVKLDLLPPEYRKEKEKHLTKLPRRLSAVAGTEFSLAIKPKAKLASLRLQLGAGKTIELKPDDEGWYQWQETLTENLKLTPKLTEPRGLTMRRPPTLQLHVYPDTKPVVKILSPDDEIAVAPDDTIQIDYVAEDDNGIGAAELVVFAEPTEEGAEPVELSRTPLTLGDERGQKRVRGSAELDLSKYKLEDGAGISYAVRVVEQRVEQRVEPPMEGQPNGGQQPAGQQLAEQGGEQTGASQLLSQASAKENNEKVAEENSSQSPADSRAAQGKDQDTERSGDLTNRGDALARSDTERPARKLESKSTASPSDSSKRSTSSDAQSKAMDAQSKAISETANEPAKNAAKDEERQADTGLAKSNIPAAQSSTQVNSAPNNKQPLATNEMRDAKADKSSSTSNSKPIDQKTASKANPSPAATGNSEQASSKKPSSGTPAPGNRSATSSSRSLVAGDMKRDEPSNAAEMPEDKKAQSDAPSEPDAPQLAATADSERTASEQDPDKATAERNAPQPSAGNEPSSSQTASQSRGTNGNNAQPNGGSDRPDNPMTRRMLDIGGQASSSNQMRIKVDKYAGSFAGQQRKKLEIAIAPSLEAIKRHLVRAQKLTRGTLDDLQANKGWQARHHRDVTAAEGTLRKAQEVARKLQGKTHNTPYAFLGLQISDISAANMTPARDYLWKSLRSEGAQRNDEVRMGWQQIGQALSRLDTTSRKYESTRREFALADATQKIEKMYRVFIEDSMIRPFGEDSGNRGSRHSRKMAELELDEEYLARLQEVMEMRRDLLAELSKILAEDPRLLRRFMDNFRNQADNLRNQLADLHDAQDRLTEEMDIWADQSKRKAALPLMAGLRLDEASLIADGLSKLSAQFDAWMPLDGDRTKGPLPETLDQINRISADARELADKAAAAARSKERLAVDDPLVKQGMEVYEGLRQLEVRLRSLGSEESLQDQSGLLINRLADTRVLITRTSSWNRRIKELTTGKMQRVAAIEQYELATKTDELAGKLADVEQQLAVTLQTEDGTLPPTIAAKAQQLLEALDRRVTPNQLAAAIALERETWSRVFQRQQAAGKGLAEAEKLFDEMLQLAIDELDQLPVQDPIAQLLQEPTLDDILRELEQQLALPEELGIPPRRSNIQRIDDWLRPGGGGGGNGGRMIARQMQSDQQRMQRAMQQARREALKRIREGRKVQVLAPKKGRKPKAESTDWNVLVSKLEDNLLQGRDKLPPKKYRAAIEQYYALINDAASDERESESDE